MYPVYDSCKAQYFVPGRLIPGPMLAHSYVPFQYLCCLYPPLKGLHEGTIFPELARPYGSDPEYVVDA